MSYRLQQQVALSTVVEVDGVPTDATMSLTVTKPDGTTVSPAINHDGVGLYSSSVLADRLRELTEAGVAERTEAGYGLTDAGAELLARLRPLDDWASHWPGAPS